jgi:DNA-binding HxlR family transcriptional regulator
MKYVNKHFDDYLTDSQSDYVVLMPKGSTSDYRIKKIEKGPLQRFKNQNLLIKKFGEVGLQIYKAITGKRTTKELKKDLGVEPKMFDQVLEYMQTAGMVELEPAAREKPKKEPPEEETLPEEAPTLEELPPEEELVEEEEVPPLEEEIKPMEEEEAEEEIKAVEEEIEKEEIAFEEEPEEEKAKEEEAKKEEEPAEEEEAPIEEEPEEEISAIAEEEAYEEESELSPVEKIISDKYGDIGLQVYSLIDGQRTAEEIMRDTGLSEQKLVEILDFMDEQGIIKLDYPRGGAEAKRPPASAPPVTERPSATKRKEEAFVPMLEEEKKLEEARGVSSPVSLPIKAPLDIVKTVQMKAKMMLKFGDKGSKILELMDGKNDIIDMALKLDMPLYNVSDIISYMLERGMAMVKPLTRSDVRKKYGDDGYSVYKKYGKEGLMLYELIGKELTIKQMADKITKDRAQVVDMFIFIHQVLGIELPIDKKVLAKELGL